MKINTLIGLALFTLVSSVIIVSCGKVKVDEKEPDGIDSKTTTLLVSGNGNTKIRL